MPRKKHRKSPVSSSKRLASAVASVSCDQVFASLSGCIDAKLRKKICPDLERHLGECEACAEFLQSLRDTVRLIEKQSTPGSAAAHIRRTVLEQYRTVMKTPARSQSAGR